MRESNFRKAYMDREYIVIRTADVEKHLSPLVQNRLEDILYAVAMGRRSDGLEPDVAYTAYPSRHNVGFDFKNYGK